MAHLGLPAAASWALLRLMSETRAGVPDCRLAREEYVARINRVMDHVERHLSENLSLEVLAKVACFSPYHFHRVFRIMVGETLHHFIQRVRLEKAASLLIQNPKETVSDIAYECGFSSSAAFARSFREAFAASASQWRAGAYKRYDRDRQGRYAQRLRGEIGEDWGIIAHEIHPLTRASRWTIRSKGMDPVVVEIEKAPPRRVAYVRHIGPYAGMAEVFSELFARLTRWAVPRGLLQHPGVEVLAVYHDNPQITEDEKLRVDACITVPDGVEPSGDIGVMTMTGGDCAVGHFVLGDQQYPEAWFALVGGWLPESGFQPDDRLCYERYLNDPREHPEGKCVVDICVPVRPL